jgi:integrase
VIAKPRRRRPRFVLRRVGENLYRTPCGNYFAILKIDGHQVRKSLKTDDRHLAKERLEEFRLQTRRQGRAAGSTALTDCRFEELAQRWFAMKKCEVKPSSWERRQYAINSLNKFFGGKPVKRITKIEVEDWLVARVRAVSPATFNKELDVLRMILQYACEHDIIQVNHAAAIKRRRVPQPKINVPTREQFRCVVAELRRYPHADQKDTKPAADLLEFIAYSGCRLGEAVAAEWQDIDWQRQTLTIKGGKYGTKNGEVRIIPVFPPLARLLMDMRSRMPTEPAPTDRVLRTRSAKISLTSICERQGIPHFLHHALRHFFASNAVESGVDFMTIAGWLGHRDGGALLARTYSHLRAEHSVAMAKRITFDASCSSASGTN